MSPCRGMMTVTLIPSFSSASGRAPITSANPPTLANGTHSPAAMTTFKRSPVYEFLCALSCPDNRFDQRHTEAAVFQFQDPINRATRGCCYKVLQLRRMFACFQHHAGRAKHHLSCQLCCGLARKTDLH